MTIARSVLRQLDVLSALLVAVALGLYLWPVGVSAPASDTRERVPGAAVLPDNGNSASPNAAPDQAQTIVNANILSASRRAPTRRYASPEVAALQEFSMPAAFAPSNQSDAQTADGETNDDRVPAFYGTVNSDGTWRALMRLSNADANPSLFKEGDRRGSYRVVSIRANAVVVAGPSGQQTLRLAAPARGDSIGKIP